VGSMGARVSAGSDGFAQAQALGHALADKVLEASRDAESSSSVAVSAVGVPITPPPLQLRLAKGWRLSPLLLPLAGVDHDAWIGAVRAGKATLVGAPGDFSGEISVKLRTWSYANEADQQGRKPQEMAFRVAPDASWRGVDRWLSATSGHSLGVRWQSAFICFPDAGDSVR